MTAKAKGNILEDLVAMMHKVPGLRVETRKKLPVVKGKVKRSREVDILIASDVAGYPVQIVLGCKNEAKTLGTTDVDIFAGILTEVGIPWQQGILVSVKGYTRDSQDAADWRGMRTLVFEGLSADRLGHEINAALQSIVYLLVSQSNLSRFPYVPDAGGGDPRFINAVLDSENEPSFTQIMTRLWELWVSDVIPAKIDEHHILLRPKNPEATWRVIADASVTGWTASVPGTFTRSILKDTGTGEIDRLHISAKFDEIKGPLTLQLVTSEDALSHLQTKEPLTVVTRVRVPRIVSNLGYWPLTAQAVQKAKALLDAGKPVTFEDIETPNIADAWP
ncbi:hypothetical protein JJE66_06875 [Bradyrhizobium diazoefficiens]|uniref:restriction endonuclease n=1 Tax=Bradyrhizobium diazoefficiens TaxID=1355477 RepID=UPI00190A0011|nr:restriction endonuclease [Bradyrhizobium diazoefficiens]MBK3660973.1 hypothetical protein [Bradyrhizobium diazoefficiens]